MLEFVHPVEQMEMKIEKLVLCEPANTVVSLTRGGLGFWNMDTGALDYRIAETTGGIVFYIGYYLSISCLFRNDLFGY